MLHPLYCSSMVISVQLDHSESMTLQCEHMTACTPTVKEYVITIAERKNCKINMLSKNKIIT